MSFEITKDALLLQEELAEKVHELESLAVSLDRALELTEYWPDIFEAGPATAAPVKLGGNRFITFVRLKNGAGEVREVPVSDLRKSGPLYAKCMSLTPPHLQDKFRRLAGDLQILDFYPDLKISN